MPLTTFRQHHNQPTNRPTNQPNTQAGRLARSKTKRNERVAAKTATLCVAPPNKSKRQTTTSQQSSTSSTFVLICFPFLLLLPLVLLLLLLLLFKIPRPFPTLTINKNELLYLKILKTRTGLGWAGLYDENFDKNFLVLNRLCLSIFHPCPAPTQSQQHGHIIE